MPTPLTSKKQIAEIVRLYKAGYGCTLISYETDVSYSTIRRIVRGEHPLQCVKLTTGISGQQRPTDKLAYRNGVKK
jgi:hypothetical protein